MLGLVAAAALAAATPVPVPPPVVVGRSVQGRSIVARRVGDRAAGRRALVVGAIHGDEGAGRAVVRLLAGADPRGVDLWLVSTLNPDGSRQRTRTNARGVDLNRNFSRGWRHNARGRGDHSGPRPFSEPETRAVRRLILRLRPRVTIWFHQPWGQVLAPCHGAASVQRRYARATRLALERCRGSGLPGTATRWQMHALPATTAFVVELGPGPLGAAAARRHARAVLAAVSPPAPSPSRYRAARPRAACAAPCDSPPRRRARSPR
jgi:protein MpaA